MDDLYLFSLWCASCLCKNNLFSCKFVEALVVGYVISIVEPLPQGNQWNSLHVLAIGTPLHIVDF